MSLFFKIFCNGLFFFLFLTNICSLQPKSLFPLKKPLIPNNYVRKKGKSLQGNIKEIFYQREIGSFCRRNKKFRVQARKIYLKILEQRLKEALLLENSKKFSDLFKEDKESIVDLFDLDIAEALYNIFTGFNNDEIREKDIYLEKFNKFLTEKDNREMNVLKKNCLSRNSKFKRKSHLKIIFYLLEYTALSYPLRIYSEEKQDFFDSVYLNPYFIEDVLYSSKTSKYEDFYKPKLLILHLGEDFNFFSSEHSQEDCECLLREVFLLDLSKSFSFGSFSRYSFPLFLKIILFTEQDQWKIFKNYLDRDLKNSFLIKNILKNFIDEFYFIRLLINISTFFQFEIENLYITRNSSEDNQSELHIFFKTNYNAGGESVLEFFKEKSKIEKAIEVFFKEGDFEKLDKIISSLFSQQFKGIKKKDFFQICIDCFKFFNEKNAFDWKKLMQRKYLFQEQMKSIYQTMSDDLNLAEDLISKDDFLHLCSLFEDFALEDLSASV